MHITWLGIASFLVETQGKTIYIDPYFEAYPYVKRKLPLADLILISHFHFDHCTAQSVERIRKDSTVILGTAEAASEFFGCHSMSENKVHDLEWAKITALPARLDKGGHHENVLGWWIELEGKKLYYTSDTGFLESMKKLSPDILIVPVGGTKTLNSREAAELTNFMKPKYAIPMHWGRITGTRDDAELFKEYVEQHRKTAVSVLEPGEMISV